MKFETNFHSKIALSAKSFCQKPNNGLSKCIFTHKNCHFQFEVKVSLSVQFMFYVA